MATIAEIIAGQETKNPKLKKIIKKAEEQVVAAAKAVEKRKKNRIALIASTYPKFRQRKNFGIVLFKAKNLDREIKQLQDGRYYVHTSRPTGTKGKVVNITIFGDRKTLQTILKGKEIVCRAIIMKKITMNEETGLKTVYHNLDLQLVNPNKKTNFELKVGQGELPEDVQGIENPQHQGGYIFLTDRKKSK